MTVAPLRVAGVDEAGRGPLAGPVTAAAVVLPDGLRLPGLTDSKALSPRRREQLAERIRDQAVCWAIASADVAEIEALNILGASLLAMRRAVMALDPPAEACLVDGNRCPSDLPCPAEAVVSGDRLHAAISAASILAKTSRDAMMLDLHREWPAYGFDRHKGYPTAAHLAALRQHGPCPAHRIGFGPVRATLAARSGS